jgi:D-alanyl-lipoteichoic acid acyltransferase DltB (MBOAT superfamily)
MLFNSFVFLLAFLPLVLAAQWLLQRAFPARAAQLFLLVASMVFYGWNRPADLPCLALSILFNFAMARLIRAAPAGPGRRRRLVLGLAGNLLLLGILKYARFAQGILLGLTGLHLPVPDLGLPLGVSFFTIQQVMYLVDCYESLADPHDLLDHLSFVAFFPYLSLGPLVRSRQVIGQLRQGGSPDPERFSRGLLLFAFGLCKKAMIAEALVTVADSGFASPAGLSWLETWVASLAFTLQIYFDFSGYTDMAVGAGLMLGITIPTNFNTPYRASSISDFWQRWHITLSQFITTYLYTPMLRWFRRATLAKAAMATLAAMAIAGLWHGPSWNYILFGVLHGAALVVNQVWRKKVKLRLPFLLSWALTMAFVVVSFIFFRTASLADAFAMVGHLLPGADPFGFSHLQFNRLGSSVSMVMLVLAFPLAVWGPNSNEWAARLRPSFWPAAATAALLLLGFFYLNSTMARDFVYFHF